LARLAFACALAFPCGASAQDAPQHQLEEKTSTELGKLQPLTEAKNWDGALALLQGLKSGVKPDSYDIAIINDIEAKVYLQKGDYAKAIPPWEHALRLSDQHQYLSPSSVQELIYFLAQIYYQEATASKNPATQKQNFAKAVGYLDRWMANTDKPERDPSRQEAQLFYSNVLYNQAVIDPENINKELLNKAEVEVEKGLRMSAHPKDTFYLILLAITQQKGDMPRLAELLELLVTISPAKKDYWSQLGGIYLNLAAQEKDESKAKEYNTRAILAIERAQSLGFMKTPKENYTLVGIYFNVGQFGRATEILHAGLRDGSIDNELKNWELLIYSYQQVDRPLQAIEAAREGSKHFPKSGQLEYQAAQIYYSLNKAEDAYRLLQTAVTKGGLERPAAFYGFLGYICWELGKLNEALAAIDKALSFPDAQRDAQLPNLRKAIEDAIQEREAATAGAKTASL
jgi:predicted Zn-dependent protease